MAAHSSERIAAPIACWIAGSAGLAADIGRSTIRCRADTERSTAPERALEHAIDIGEGTHGAILAADRVLSALACMSEVSNGVLVFSSARGSI